AFYADGWHLLMRDKQGPKVWSDVAAFIRDPSAPLPSGAPPIPAAGAPARIAITQEAPPAQPAP
ncbi:MAG TPA: hypothetical protein VFE03_02275, partial [Caulobacteraceae bacterium]|nr:hypothetical protein [Caulobacteraceae bacterium]